LENNKLKNPHSSFFIDYGTEKDKHCLLKYTQDRIAFIYMQYLDWDSNFFSKKSYNLDISKSNFNPNKNFIESFENDFSDSFISIKLDTNYDYEYVKFLQECDFKYIDTEVELNLNNKVVYQDDDRIDIKRIGENFDLPYEELGSSFSLTRFHTDLNIDNNKADLLWIEYLKNFTPDKNKYIYIAKIEDRYIGVILVNILEKIVNISYIAVIEEYRSFGIGQKLIQKVINDFSDFEIKTETQVKNIKALNFYIQNGFMISNTYSVFHRWS